MYICTQNARECILHAKIIYFAPRMHESAFHMHFWAEIIHICTQNARGCILHAKVRGGAGYFGKRKWREKWPEKRKSIKNQRQPAMEIEVLQSEIIILLAIEIA